MPGASADAYRRHAAATRASTFDGVGPAMQALRDTMHGSDGETEQANGSDALTDATQATERFETALGNAGSAATDAGAATVAAAAAAEPAAKAAATGWQAVTAALSVYASKARETDRDIGQSLVSAFQSAENAVAEFVKTRKLNFRDHVTSPVADLAKLGARRFILGPLSNAVGGISEGDAFTVRAGCDKRIETCGAKFANTPSFRGFRIFPARTQSCATPRRTAGPTGACCDSRRSRQAAARLARYAIPRPGEPPRGGLRLPRTGARGLARGRGPRSRSRFRPTAATGARPARAKCWPRWRDV